MKHQLTLADQPSLMVAPRRGAWIETGSGEEVKCAHFLSHPAGVRGLKP